MITTISKFISFDVKYAFQCGPVYLVEIKRTDLDPDVSAKEDIYKWLLVGIDTVEEYQFISMTDLVSNVYQKHWVFKQGELFYNDNYKHKSKFFHTDAGELILKRTVTSLLNNNPTLPYNTKHAIKEYLNDCDLRRGWSCVITPPYLTTSK